MFAKLFGNQQQVPTQQHEQKSLDIKEENTISDDSPSNQQRIF